MVSSEAAWPCLVGSGERPDQCPGDRGLADVAIVVPIFCATSDAERLLSGIRSLNPQPMEVVLLESSPLQSELKKETVGELLAGVRWSLYRLRPRSFDHGSTRNLGNSLVSQGIGYTLFLTQDAYPEEPASLEKMIAASVEEDAAVVVGRQLPHAGAAAPLDSYMRTERYPSSQRRIPPSNAFALYRRSDLDELGGFDEPAGWGEDLVFASRALREGRTITYEPEATVLHSHEDAPRQVFERAYRRARLKAEVQTVDGWSDRPSTSSYVLGEFKAVLRANLWHLPKWMVILAARAAGTIGGRLYLSAQSMRRVK